MQGFGTNVKQPKDVTAPVSPGVEARYEVLLDELGGDEEMYPFPETDAEARRLMERMAQEYARLKAEDRLPAKAAQVHYAGLISDKLGLPQGFSERPTRNEVGAFIEANRENYRLSFEGASRGPR